MPRSVLPFRIAIKRTVEELDPEKATSNAPQPSVLVSSTSGPTDDDTLHHGGTRVGEHFDEGAEHGNRSNEPRESGPAKEDDEGTQTDEESQGESASTRKNALRPRTIRSAYTNSWDMRSETHFSPQPPQVQPIQSIVMEDASLLDSVVPNHLHLHTPRDMIPSRIHSNSHPTSFSHPTQLQSVIMDDASSFDSLSGHTPSFWGTSSSENNAASQPNLLSHCSQHRVQTLSLVESVVKEDTFTFDQSLDTLMPQACSSQRTPSMMDVDLMSRSGSLMSIDEPDPKSQGSLARELEPFCRVGMLTPSVPPAPCLIQGPQVAVLHPVVPPQVDNTSTKPISRLYGHQFSPQQHSQRSPMVYSPGTSFGYMPPSRISSGLAPSSPYLPLRGMSTFNPHANSPPQTIDITTNPMSLFHESKPVAACQTLKVQPPGTYNYTSPTPPSVASASQLHALNPCFAQAAHASPGTISACPMVPYSSQLEAKSHRVDNHANSSDPGYRMVQYYPGFFSEFSVQSSASGYPAPGFAEPVSGTSCGLEDMPTTPMDRSRNVEAAGPIIRATIELLASATLLLGTSNLVGPRGRYGRRET